MENLGRQSSKVCQIERVCVVGFNHVVCELNCSIYPTADVTEMHRIEASVREHTSLRFSVDSSEFCHTSMKLGFPVGYMIW